MGCHSWRVESLATIYIRKHQHQQRGIKLNNPASQAIHLETRRPAKMPRGPKKHLKRRLNAPKHWMLDKLGGVFAPEPSAGPHKMRECLPLVVFLRNRLKYALTYDEVKKIVNQRLVKVDGKVRSDKNYPAGFMDVISIEKNKREFPPDL